MKNGMFTSICLASLTVFSLLAVTGGTANGDDIERTYRLEAIDVIAERPVRWVDDPTAPVTVITREDIEALNARSIGEVLKTIASVDLIERGTPGSQTDIAVRGSSIEGVLVLIDGIRVHDPQTGHFTLDLPIGIESVERIEVLTGGGSGIYGGSAPGGVINIVSRTGGDTFGASLSGGSYGTGTGHIAVSHEWDPIQLNVVLRGAGSDGYRDDSDLTSSGFTMTGDAFSGGWRFKWNLGMLKKSFGAGDFYAPYPSFEETMTLSGGMNMTRVVSKRQAIRIRFGIRGHDDEYTLIRDNPAVYKNLHYNRNTGFAVEYIYAPTRGVMFFTGTEVERFGITSGSLGTRSDVNAALYSQLTAEAGAVDITTALRFDRGFQGERVLSPSLGLSYRLTREVSLRFRAERSYRPPNYTELYYESPTNRGNTQLNSEFTRSIEAGCEYTDGILAVSSMVFAKHATDVIDWVRRAGGTVWQVDNHGRIVTRGIETATRMRLGESWQFRSSLMVLDQSIERRQDIESKYALNPLDRVLSVTATGPVSGVVLAATVRYEHQLHGDTRTPATLKVSYLRGPFRYTLSAENIFNESYEELSGLPAPGRWLMFQVDYTR